MGLSSVFSTAITGLTGAETTIDVAGNNVANSNTIGFKSSQVLFATQFVQTLSLGSAPTATSGGTNPRQIGLGTQVAAISPDFTQGTLSLSASPSDLAIQGDGFFIVEGTTGEQLYTRNGKFQVNSQNELVTINGDRLQGYGVDDDFQIQSTTLQSLTIPLGAAAVAKATENVNFVGTLPPNGDIADTSAIIQTGVLGDAQFAAPAAGATALLANVPNVAGPPATLGTPVNGAGTMTNSGVYQYKIVFADRPIGQVPDTLSRESAIVNVTLGAADDTVDFTDLPTSANYPFMRIYRTAAGGATFHLVAEQATGGPGTYTDTLDDATLLTNPTLAAPEQTLSGNYSYYVVFSDTAGGPPNGVESRPSPAIGPYNAVNGRIQIDNIPTDGSGAWSVRRIYRNLSTDPGSFHFVAEIPNNNPGESYTDSISDATIMANPEIDFDGPRINTNTLLTDVLQRSNGVTQPVFQEGVLSFSGYKGDRLVDDPDAPPTFEITATSTVLDLINFMSDSLGIQRPPGPDALNPIPADGPTGDNPGPGITANGEIRFVSNTGVDNAVEIRLSSLTLVPTGSTTASQVNLSFSESQEARGESAVADVVVYDSLGIPLNLRITTVLESLSGTETTYRWFADSRDNDPVSGDRIAVGTGLIRFDGEGNLIGTTNNTVSIDRVNIPSASPLEIDLDFSQVSGLAKETNQDAELSASRQDGFPPGKLSSFIIGEDGVIRGVFDNGTQRDLGQIRLARFANNSGLDQRGENLWASGVNSGLPVIGNPGEQGIGEVIAGAVELSNTDIGENLIDLILASTMYRGNARVITTAQQLLDELLNLRR